MILKIPIILFHLVTVGIFYTPSLDHIKASVNTSEDLEYYFSYFKYKKDVLKKDNWRSSVGFYKNGGDDCEGFAVFGYELLSNAGYDCNIYSFWNENDGHAILTYKKNNDIGYFSNNVRNEGEFFLIDIVLIKGYKSYKLMDWKEEYFIRQGIYYKEAK